MGLIHYMVQKPISIHSILLDFTIFGKADRGKDAPKCLLSGIMLLPMNRAYIHMASRGSDTFEPGSWHRNGGPQKAHRTRKTCWKTCRKQSLIRRTSSGWWELIGNEANQDIAIRANVLRMLTVFYNRINNGQCIKQEQLSSWKKCQLWQEHYNATARKAIVNGEERLGVISVSGCWCSAKYSNKHTWRI